MKLPEVTNLVASYLRAELSVAAQGKAPATVPATFVHVMRTGGVLVNRIVDRAQVTLTCWAPDVAAAERLAADVALALTSASGSVDLVRGVGEVSGPYFDPDPVSGRPRYSMTVPVTVRATRA